MAFLSKQKKFDKIFPQSDNTLGPGEYLPITKLKLFTQNPVPFLTSQERNITSFSTSLTPTPGPGAYFNNDNNAITSSTHSKNKTTTNFHLRTNNINMSSTRNTFKSKSTNINSYNESTTLSKDIIAFNSQVPRFKEKKQLNIPGPGFYFTNNSNNDTTHSIKDKKNKHILSNSDLVITNSLSMNKLCNFTTIPTKERKFGYEYAPNGMLFPVENPNYYKTFTGDKDDMVGPGNYELCLPEQWHKTGTEWSKYKRTKEIPKHKKIKDNILQSLAREEGDKEEAMMIKSMQNFRKANYIKQNALSYKYNIKTLNVLKIPMKGSYTDDIIKTNKYNPGPGYYYIEKNNTAFNPDKGTKTYRINFIEKYTIPLIDKANTISQVSPVSYFRNDLKLLKQLKRKYSLNKNDNNNNRLTKSKSTIGFNSTTTRFGSFNINKTNKNVNINDIMLDNNNNNTKVSNFHKKSFNYKTSPFGSTSLRFNPKLHNPANILYEQHLPGPGSYINPYSSTGTQNTVLFGDRLISSQYAKKLSITPSSQTQKHKHQTDTKPSIGSYNPETIYTIEYNNLKHITKNKNIPFNSSLSKIPAHANSLINIRDIAEHNNIGPGSYTVIPFTHFTQINPPFKTGAKRILFKSNSSDNVIGVGTYNINSNYPWMKKEYNALYINNNNNNIHKK